MNFNPFPVLHTKRLTLRAMQTSDAFDLFEMRHDEHMHEYTDTFPDPSIEDTLKYIDKMTVGVANNLWIIWAIELLESKKVIGSICIWNIEADNLSAELGCGIMPSYQGLGYMKEALVCVVEYGFHELGLKTLEAYTEKANIPSIKLLNSSGFIATKVVIDSGFLKNRDFEMIVYQKHNK
jgi:ribosomal-protein-alanine N-acetyltransferase